MFFFQIPFLPEAILRNNDWELVRKNDERPAANLARSALLTLSNTVMPGGARTQ